MKNLLRLIRPHQWLKNGFVFIPMFFGGGLFRADSIAESFITFVSFCFIASSIYCFNDIIDAEADRKHPAKRNRPIASGAIGTRKAYALMASMALLALSVLLLLPGKYLETGAIILFYFAMNVAYCRKLKQYAIVDVCIISFGFVLRILAGGVATSIILSNWVVLMTFLLALFLSFAKRRDDVVRMNETGEAPRRNTIRYNLTFINQAITITASVTLVCYVMYTVSPEVTGRFGTEYLYLTSIFVLVGLLRYIQLTVVDKRSGDPSKILLHDRFTQCVVLGWITAFLVIIYLLRA